MRVLATLVALVLSAPALAQDTGFIQEDVTSKRFPDAEVDGPKLTAGARVTVLVREEERLRVRAGTSYGWVPADVVAETKPDTGAAPVTFDEAALQELLKQAGADGGMRVPGR